MSRPLQTWTEVEEEVDELRKQHPNSLLLFRGQRRLHGAIRSGRARPGMSIPRDVEAGWHSLVSQFLPKPQRTQAHTKAILQHYGMATHYVDLTSSLDVAAWFATHKYSRKIMLYAGTAFREYEHVSYEPSDSPFGYVLVIAVTDPNRLQNEERLFDLSALPQERLRPHHQKGWLMLDRPPTEPTPNDFWVATLLTLVQ